MQYVCISAMSAEYLHKICATENLDNKIFAHTDYQKLQDRPTLLLTVLAAACASWHRNNISTSSNIVTNSRLTPVVDPIVYHLSEVLSLCTTNTNVQPASLSGCCSGRLAYRSKRALVVTFQTIVQYPCHVYPIKF